MKQYLLIHIFWVAILVTGVGGGAWADDNQGLEVRLSRVTFEMKNPPAVNLFVSVVEGDRACRGLGPANFHITENGRPFQGDVLVTPFVLTERDLVYAILIERGEDIGTSLSMVKKATIKFIEEMGFRYKGSIVSYSGEPSVLKGRLADVAAGIKPGGGQARLVDGLVAGLDILKQIQEKSPAPDQKAIILFTEGKDHGGLFSWEAAIDGIMETNCRLFVIGYGAGREKMLAKAARAARESGGHYFHVSNPDEMPDVLLAVSDMLKQVYVLSYTSDSIALDGKVHSIKIVVSGKQGRGRSELDVITPVLKGADNRLYWVLGTAGVLLILLFALFIRFTGKTSSDNSK